MSDTATRAVTITTIAELPEHTMPENLAVRADGSVLVVASPNRQLWYVPAPTGTLPVEPTLMHTFEEGALAQSFVEVEPEIFYVATYGRPALYRFDLTGWHPGQPVEPVRVGVEFDPNAGLNGSALLAPGVLLYADCNEGQIIRVDLAQDGLTGTARTWLRHGSMDPGGGRPPVKFADGSTVPFPGINGLRYGRKTGFVYYATSSQGVFMRVKVDPGTLSPEGDVELVAKVVNCDDLCLDEDAGIGFVARHPDHVVEQVTLDPHAPGASQSALAGDPFDERLIGPTSVDWGRGDGEVGRIMYATTDGGIIQAAPDGVSRPPRLVRLELASAEG